MSREDRPLGWNIYEQRGGEPGHPPPGDPVYVGFMPNTRRRRIKARAARFWRWYTAPTESLADITVTVGLVAGAVALRLNAGWPWWASILTVFAAFCAATFANGFVREFRRLTRRGS